MLQACMTLLVMMYIIGNPQKFYRIMSKIKRAAKIELAVLFYIKAR